MPSDCPLFTYFLHEIVPVTMLSYFGLIEESTLLESTCNDLQFFRVNRSKGAAIVVSTSTGTSTNSSAQVSKAGQTFTSIMTSIKMFSDRILRFELKSLLKFLSK